MSRARRVNGTERSGRMLREALARGPSAVRRRQTATRSLAAATFLIVAIGCGALGCQGDGLRHVRALTYPPDFHYITSQEIHTTMGGLAVEVSALDEMMRKPGGPLPEERERVVAILTRMNGLAAQLKQGTQSNHPRIDHDAPRLRQDIERSLDGARMVPPNYYDAGRVAGACTYCHAPPDVTRR